MDLTGRLRFVECYVGSTYYRVTLIEDGALRVEWRDQGNQWRRCWSSGDYMGSSMQALIKAARKAEKDSAVLASKE